MQKRSNGFISPQMSNFHTEGAPLRCTDSQLLSIRTGIEAIRAFSILLCLRCRWWIYLISFDLCMFLWHGGKFPLCRGKSLVLFGVGPGPVLCCLLLLPEAKRKSGWGICGSSLSFWSVFLVCFSDLPSLFYRGTPAFHCEILIRLTRLHQF